MYGDPDKMEASRHLRGSTFRFHIRCWNRRVLDVGSLYDHLQLPRPCDPEKSGFFVE
jgi:hypothetical protein